MSKSQSSPFKKPLLTVLIGLSCVLQTSAHADNLNEVYQQAIKQDANLAAASARYAAIKQATPIARSALLPQISASAEWQHHDQKYKDIPAATRSIYNDDKYNQKSYSLELNQSLYNREQWLALEQSKSEIKQANSAYRLVSQDLILRTAKAYFELLGAKDNHRFALAEKKAISHQLYQAKERFNLGLSTITDISESEAQYDLAEAQAIDAHFQLNMLKEDLRVITGSPVDYLSPLKTTVKFRTPPENEIETWVNKALTNNPGLLASQQQVETASKEVKRKRAGHLPTVDFTAKYSVEDEDGGSSEGINNDTSFGVALKLPIYSGGKVSAEVREAHNLYRQTLKDHELKKRQTSREARAAFMNVHATLARINALQKAVVSTSTAAKAADAGYKEGIRTAVDVLLALRENFRAKRDLTKARYDFVLGTLRLKQVCGTLNEKDLEQVNSWLLG